MDTVRVKPLEFLEFGADSDLRKCREPEVLGLATTSPQGSRRVHLAVHVSLRTPRFIPCATVGSLPCTSLGLRTGAISDFARVLQDLTVEATLPGLCYRAMLTSWRSIRVPQVAP